MTQLAHHSNGDEGTTSSLVIVATGICVRAYYLWRGVKTLHALGRSSKLIRRYVVVKLFVSHAVLDTARSGQL